MNFIMIIIGLVLLIFGADWLVRSGVSLAAKFNISSLMIGLTIVSMGTSMPELMVSVSAAFNGYSDMAMGNVIGSNIVNISMILGVTALVMWIPVSKESVRISWPFMVFVSILLYVFALNFRIERWEGIILVLLQIGFVYFLYYRSKHLPEPKNSEKPKTYPVLLALLILVISIGALMFGASLLVDGAVNLAKSMGVSERIISLTVVAVGTSVPELATSLVAAFRKQMDISIGNLIGSNIFNILSIIGLAAIIKPVNVSPQMLHVDIYWAIGMTLLLGIMFIPFRKPIIKRWKGAILLFAYLAYYFFIF